MALSFDIVDMDVETACCHHLVQVKNVVVDNIFMKNYK